MPIYYVLLKNNPPHMLQISVWHIIKVIACNLDELETVYDREFGQLVQADAYYTTMIFAREPDNPLKDKAEFRAESQILSGGLSASGVA